MMMMKSKMKKARAKNKNREERRKKYWERVNRTYIKYTINIDRSQVN